MIRRFDVAVIGAGAAGLSVAYGTTRLGMQVVLIERGAMGGDCLNYGCVPSKALLHAARIGLGWEAARARVMAAIATIEPNDSAARYEDIGCTVMHGAARLLSDREIEVGGQHIRAGRIVIATGSQAIVPEFCAGLEHYTNETLWGMTALPARLCILGAGPMGCEMAEAFANLGVRVTLIGRMLPREAPELVAPVAAALQRLGVVHIAQRAINARAGADGVPVISLADGREVAGIILLAAGRRVEAASLGLDLPGGADGIRTDARLRVLGYSRIFAAGDCADPAGIGPQRLTHVAGAHASLLVRRLAFRLPARLSDVAPVRVVYTAPELAQIGAIDGARVLERRFAENDRAIAEGETAGLVRLVLDARGRLIGAGITGPHAGEMIGMYALAIARKIPLSALAGLVLPYPTRAEAGRHALGGYFAERLFAAWPRKIVGLLNRLP